MKKLLFFLKKYRKESILSPLLKMLEALTDLAVPLLVAMIVDDGVAAGDRAVVIRTGLLMVAAALAGLLLAVIAQYFAARASAGAAAQMRHDLFAKIQSLSFTELDRTGTATLITRMTSDVNQVQNGINMGLRLLLRSPFIVFGALIMALLIDVPSALVFALAIPLLGLVVFTIILSTMPLYRGVQHKLDAVLGRTRQNLSGVRVLRAFCKEEEESEQFILSNKDLMRAQKFVGAISAILNPATYLILNLAIVALVWRGAVRIDSGDLSQGQLIALYNYMLQILVELIKLANLIILLSRSGACMKRIGAVLDMRSSLMVKGNAVPEKAEGRVEFEHVSLRYSGAGADSLQNISLSCGAGEHFGIIGATGSGKTSLVQLIPRFYDCTEGCVRVDGVDVRDMDPTFLRGLVGYVPQKAVLFSGSVRENLLWGNPDATDEELWQALRAAQAEEVILNKPGGLDEPVEQDGRNFSGGQRQRLCIARALVGSPRILILDDSSSALDYATDAALRAALRSLPWHPTVFIVSQRISSLRGADRIIVLEEGLCAGQGTHDELLKDCEIYREIDQIQTEGGPVHAS
ncbi:MAG: ABC transporter ATP-binding protein [Clostridia bacterium]|nr:ABC transporter ATP-binding protein [Clostridia bacterium]